MKKYLVLLLAFVTIGLSTQVWAQYFPIPGTIAVQNPSNSSIASSVAVTGKAPGTKKYINVIYTYSSETNTYLTDLATYRYDPPLKFTDSGTGPLMYGNFSTGGLPVGELHGLGSNAPYVELY